MLPGPTARFELHQLSLETSGAHRRRFVFDAVDTPGRSRFRAAWFDPATPVHAAAAAPAANTRAGGAAKARARAMLGGGTTASAASVAAIIFVIDSSDHFRFPVRERATTAPFPCRACTRAEADGVCAPLFSRSRSRSREQVVAQQLRVLGAIRALAAVPVLVLAHKQDERGALATPELCAAVGLAPPGGGAPDAGFAPPLRNARGRMWTVAGTSLRCRPELVQAVEWAMRYAREPGADVDEPAAGGAAPV